MSKLFTLVIVLVASSAFADDVPEDNLQSICDVVEHMDYVTLCNLNYTSTVQENYPATNVVTLTFETTQAGCDTTGICDCIKGYMYNAVGSVVTDEAYCVSTPTSFKIVYQGDYDPVKESLPPLKKLANAISAYAAPDLGGWICSQKVTESESGWVYIKVKTFYDGNRCHVYGDYRDVCDDITEYLIQGDFLAKSKRKCTRRGDYVIVDLWADE